MKFWHLIASIQILLLYLLTSPCAAMFHCKHPGGPRIIIYKINHEHKQSISNFFRLKNQIHRLVKREMFFQLTSSLFSTSILCSLKLIEKKVERWLATKRFSLRLIKNRPINAGNYHYIPISGVSSTADSKIDCDTGGTICVYYHMLSLNKLIDKWLTMYIYIYYSVNI